MVRKDSAFLKATRLEEIQKTIIQGISISKGVNYEKLLAEIEYSKGLNRDTIERYVKLIMDRQGLILVNGKIVVEILGDAK
jgi:hypothetical protein